MANRYETFTPTAQEVKKGPNLNTLKNILNFSRSLEVKRTKQESVLIHLN
ncbi:MAG: hypothetical protein WEA99_01655 [Brumimicrobium sp.]